MTITYRDKNGVELKHGDEVKVDNWEETHFVFESSVYIPLVASLDAKKSQMAMRSTSVEKVEKRYFDKRGVEIKIGSAIVCPTRDEVFTVKSLDRGKERDFVIVTNSYPGESSSGFWLDDVLVLA